MLFSNLQGTLSDIIKILDLLFSCLVCWVGLYPTSASRNILRNQEHIYSAITKNTILQNGSEFSLTVVYCSLSTTFYCWGIHNNDVLGWAQWSLTNTFPTIFPYKELKNAFKLECTHHYIEKFRKKCKILNNAQIFQRALRI